VNQPVENAIRHGQVADLFVPAGTGNRGVRRSDRIW
jgi:hypothetical protein